MGKEKADKKDRKKSGKGDRKGTASGSPKGAGKAAASMGAKGVGKTGSSKKVDTKHCVSCRNFDADKKGGWCRHHDKKRSASDKTCGSYKQR